MLGLGTTTALVGRMTGLNVHKIKLGVNSPSTFRAIGFELISVLVLMAHKCTLRIA